MRIGKTFYFEAAHHLPNVPPGHQCGSVHGHSYQVDVEVDGPLDGTFGWVVDFAEVSRAWASTGGTLDHTNLNDTLDNPTAEELTLYLASELDQLVPVAAVTVHETRTSWARWEATRG